MLASAVAILSHVPGGYGVFEGLVIHFLPKEQGPAVIAALLVFRMIYDWIPVMIAAVLLGYNELTIENPVTERPSPAENSVIPATPPISEEP
jgi:phosphatidylglycerol lysyltransferase